MPATASRELRRDIRQMCGYIQDDGTVAAHHRVSVEQVAAVRAAIPAAKRLGKERTAFSHNATGASVIDINYMETRAKLDATAGCEAMLKAMIRTGCHWLKPAELQAACAERGWG